MFFLQQAPSLLASNLIFFLAIIFVMYFFFMRPQVKKQKEQEEFLNQLKKGDEVVLGSGIIAKINKIEGKTVQLQIDQKNYLTVLKSAISKELTAQQNKKED